MKERKGNKIETRKSARCRKREVGDSPCLKRKVYLYVFLKKKSSFGIFNLVLQSGHSDLRQADSRPKRGRPKGCGFR